MSSPHGGSSSGRHRTKIKKTRRPGSVQHRTVGSANERENGAGERLHFAVPALHRPLRGGVSILVYEGREADAIRTLGYSVMFAALAFATKLLCKTDPDRPREGRNLPLQFATIGAAMIVTALVSVHFGSEDDRPSDAMQAIYSTGCWQFFVEVCAVFVILRLLKLRGVDLGLRAWATGAVWVAIIWITTAVGFCRAT